MSPETATHSSEPASPAVAFTDVTCHIGTRTVLEQVNLSIPRGSVAGILGANGAGKTTPLGAVSGLRPAFSGTVTVLGETQTGRELSLRRRMGVVFQETALHDELTTAENLEFAASLYDISDPKERISEVLDLLGLTDRARERVGRLSGGLRRRVTLAHALLHDSELLIIDEPTLGVDVEARHTLWAHLRLLRAGGTTVIVSTNYLDEALALCDTVSVLRGGRLLVTDTPAALVTLFASGLGAMLGTLLRGPRVIALAASLFTKYLFFLGGGFTTIAFLPAWLHLVSAFNPTRYAIDGLRQTLFYPDLAGFGVDLAILTDAALVAAALGAVAVRHSR